MVGLFHNLSPQCLITTNEKKLENAISGETVARFLASAQGEAKLNCWLEFAEEAVEVVCWI